MEIRVKRAILLLAVWGLAGACSEPAEPSPQLDAQAGILQLEGFFGPTVVNADSVRRDTTIRWTVPPGERIWPPDVLVVPAEVAAGQPFTIKVTTIGESGCARAESQTVTITGTTVELKPYDVIVGNICTMNLVSLLHESTVTLTAPGTWTVRVRGRIVRHGDRTWETPVAAEKTIVVR